MEKLIKKITLSDDSDNVVIEFRIGTNRKIFAETLEEFPEFSKKIFNNKQGGKIDIETLIDDKKFSELFFIQDSFETATKFALPKMLEFAEEKNIDDVMCFINENELPTEFYTEIFDFLCLAFMSSKQEKPKFKFAIK